MLSLGQHTLIKQPEGDDLYKHCILVKLTDSSSKAIEEFLKNKNSSKKPSIVFHTDKAGEITFPIESSNSNKKFSFSLSGVKESYGKDASAALECVHYTNNKLKTIGTVEQKLTVQANDEVFQATKEKVNSVEEEAKKNSTIEIKHLGSKVNRASLGSNMMMANRNKTPINKPNPITSQEMIKPRNPVLDRPLKERLIHFLAVKSYNKAELMLKLGKDTAFNEKEKEQFESLLQTVAVFNQKNSTYEISNEVMLNEVKEDWQFYNPNEKLFVKKNINKVKEKMASVSLNQSLPVSLSQKYPNKPSAFSIPASSGNKSLNLSSNFETSFDELSSSIDKSMHNVSINKRVSPQKSEQFKPISANHQTKNQRPPSQQQTSILHKQASDLFSSSTSSDEMSADDLSFNLSTKRPNDKDELANGNSRKHKIDFEYKERSQEIESKELKECQRKYRKITNPQQKQQYMQDYDMIYKEYLDLHQYVDGVREKFERLRADLSLFPDMSKEYAERKQKVISDYVDKKSDQEYLKKRDRYSQVYTKLKFLHDLLKESDES